MLREDQLTLGNNVEYAVDTPCQFRLQPGLPRDFGRQTGGLRKIVSTHTVGNSDAHDEPPDSP
jgi:hypothetical protein